MIRTGHFVLTVRMPSLAGDHVSLNRETQTFSGNFAACIDAPRLIAFEATEGS